MENNGNLIYVKKVIHSLVVSAPHAMTIESLNRDYLKEEGHGVPYNKLGFRNIDSFLRNIPDTITVVGYGPMALLFAVSKENTAHIQDLVRCQKKTSKRRTSIRGKPKYVYKSEASDLVFVNETPAVPVSNLSHNSRNSNSQNRNMGQLHEIAYHRSRPRQRQNYPVDKPAAGFNLIHSQQVVESLNQISTKQMIQDKIYLDEVKENISKDQFEEQELDDYQWKKSELGQNKLAKDKPDERQCEKYTLGGDRCVTELSNSSDEKYDPIQEEKEVKVLSRPTNTLVQEFFESDYESTDEGIDEDAMPAFAIDDRVINLTYPRTAVRFDFVLPENNVEQSLNLGERVQVQLVKIDNPHSFKFWIRNDDEDDYVAMYNNMQKTYNDLKSLEFIMPLFLITTGHLCVVRSNAIWERARVVNYKPENAKKTIEVNLIDTGCTVCVCPKDVHYLFKEFAILPPQCLPGRLAYVAPWKGSGWSADAVQSFFRLVHYRVLYAKVEQIENSAYLVLVDPETESNNICKNINVRFVESGWARRCYTP